MLQAVRPFIEFYRTASFGTPAPSHQNLSRLWHGLSLGWEAAKRYRRLSMMNDDQLARLGLDRATIGRCAFFGDPPFGHR